jgi:hypothetical protein
MPKKTNPIASEVTKCPLAPRHRVVSDPDFVADQEMSDSQRRKPMEQQRHGKPVNRPKGCP